jgi:hypothetical protein
MLMETTRVQSTTLTTVVYDGHRNLLQLCFQDGSIYDYFSVPAQTHRGLLASASKGVYFNREIRGKFPYATCHKTKTN